MGVSTSRPLSTLVRVTVLLWCATFVAIGALYFRLLDPSGCLAPLIYAGVTLTLLCASIAVSALLKQRMEVTRDDSVEAPLASGLNFRALATRRWLAWDYAFGVVVPLAVLLIDPWVFRSSPGEKVLFPEYRGAAYIFIIQNIVVLGIWLMLEPPCLALWVSGALFGAAAGALVIGVALLPFSVVSLFFFGAGILGLIPFITAVTFLRRSIRALKAAGPNSGRILAASKVSAGAVLAVAPAVICQLATNGFHIPESLLRMLH